MGKLVAVGYSRLDRYVEEAGEDGVMNEVCSRIAEGESLKSIAQTFAMPYSVLWNFLSVGERMTAYRQAKEAAAEALADEVLTEADKSEIVRDRVDARKWLAGRWNRGVYGDKADADQKVGITVIVNRDGIDYSGG